MFTYPPPPPPSSLHVAVSAADIAEARHLFRAYAGWLGVDLSFQGFEAELAGLPGAYASPKGRLVLARVGAMAVGCAALRPLGDGVCEMKRLYVLPEHQGRGMGRALAQRIIEEARGIGYRRMVLDTLASMAPALALYRSLGCNPVAPYTANPLAGAVFLGRDL